MSYVKLKNVHEHAIGEEVGVSCQACQQLKHSVNCVDAMTWIEKGGVEAIESHERHRMRRRHRLEIYFK